MGRRHTSGVFCVRYMAEGKDGLPGLTPRLSVWQSGTEYRNDEHLETYDRRYLDYVTDTAYAIEGTDAYNLYLCKQTHTSGTNKPLPSGDENTWWVKVPAEPIIGPLILAQKIDAHMIDVDSLLADSAFINNLTVQKLDTDPTQPGGKIVISNNEIRLLDDSGSTKVRVSSDAVAELASGNGLYRWSKYEDELTFTNGHDYITIPVGSSGGSGSILKTYNLGSFPKGSTIKANPNGMYMGFTALWERLSQDPSDHYYICTEGDRKILQTVVSNFKVEVIDADEDVILTCFSNRSDTERETGGIYTDNNTTPYALIAYGADTAPGTWPSAVLSEDTELSIRISGDISVATVDAVTGSDDKFYFNTIEYSCSGLSGGSFRIQEPSTVEIGDAGMFLRYSDDGKGYGYIVDDTYGNVNGGGLFFYRQGSGYATGFGLDSGGVFLYRGTSKEYITGGGGSGTVTSVSVNGGTPVEPVDGNVDLDITLADLPDDNNHKTVSVDEKNTWNSKYDKPGLGIPSTDFSGPVQKTLEVSNWNLNVGKNTDADGEITADEVIEEFDPTRDYKRGDSFKVTDGLGKVRTYRFLLDQPAGTSQRPVIGRYQSLNLHALANPLNIMSSDLNTILSMN